MIKTGICTLQDLKTRDTTRVLKKLKNVSITLYDQILQEPDADALAERILLLFSDERGAYKRTYAKRFEDFDPMVLGHLVQAFKQDDALKIQDVGVSDGRTALDFFEKMADLFPNLTYTASDYNPKVYVLEKGASKITVSHTGKVLEILFPPFVFNTVKRDSYRAYPLNHLVRWATQRGIVAPLLKAYQAGKVQAKELMLFAPQVLRRAQQDPRFVLAQHDVLQPLREQAHVIRAMNILNPLYFTDSEFRQVISHLHAGLYDGGFLITGSNQDAGSLVHGGIYQKTPQGFRQIEQSGDGSHVDDLILKANL